MPDSDGMTRRGFLGTSAGAALIGLRPALAAAAVNQEALARDAYIWGYPLVLFGRYRDDYRQQGNPLNQLIVQTSLSTPATPGGGPNVDTIYGYTWLDLRAGPQVLHVPEAQDRYYSIQLIDMYSDSFAYVGRRATGTRAGTFAIIGPFWKGKLPKGLKAIRSPTDDVICFSRTAVADDADLPAALAKLKAGDVAAVLTISGKPSPGLTQFDSTGGYHLVSVPYTGSMQDAYYPGRLDNADYPNLVPAGAGLETVAVGTLLAVHDVPRGSPRYQRLAAFTKAFFARFDALRDPARHPKWREVNLAADVPGWTRFRAATEALAHSPEPAVTAAAKAPTEARSAAGEPSGSTPTGGTRLSGKVDPQNIDLVGRLSRRSGTEHLGRTTEFDRFVASHAAGANISDLSEAQQDRLLREFQKWKRKHRI